MTLLSKISMLALVCSAVMQWAHSREQYSPGVFGMVGLFLVVAGSLAVVALVVP